MVHTFTVTTQEFLDYRCTIKMECHKHAILKSHVKVLQGYQRDTTSSHTGWICTITILGFSTHQALSNPCCPHSESEE